MHWNEVLYGFESVMWWPTIFCTLARNGVVYIVNQNLHRNLTADIMQKYEIGENELTYMSYRWS